jgi:histidine kinase/DNA gyrase B/HSP90-like ATPase
MDRRATQAPPPPEPLRLPPPLNQLPWEFAKDQFGAQGADFIGVMGTLIIRAAKDQFKAYVMDSKRLSSALPLPSEKTRPGFEHTETRAGDDATGVSPTGPAMGASASARAAPPSDMNTARANSSAVLQHTLSSLSEAIREGGATVTHDVLPEVSMSEAHLQQMFQNIIGNALKYRKDDPPQIHISAIKADDAWCFSVRDNGIGIDPQYKEKIFGVFKRLHRDQKYSGTGIGLAICHRVVERYGGRIWVESAPGGGATFCFTVPETNRRSRSAAAKSSAG